MSALAGYCTALELLGKVTWHGLNTSSHQDQLLYEPSDSLVVLQKDCVINLGQFEDAVELLDLGQSILWHWNSHIGASLLLFVIVYALQLNHSHKWVFMQDVISAAIEIYLVRFI